MFMTSITGRGKVKGKKEEKKEEESGGEKRG